jgi:hypothetical protein
LQPYCNQQWVIGKDSSDFRCSVLVKVLGR